MNTNLISPEGRLSFPYLSEPCRTFDASNDKLEVTLIFPSDVDIQPMLDGVEKAAIEKFGTTKYDALVKSGKFKSPFKSNSTKVDNDGNPRQGFEDAEGTHVKFTCKFGIQVVDSKLQDIEPDLAKAGYWGRVRSSVAAYDSGANVGVSAYFKTLQVTRVDEEFGSGDALEGFGIVASENAFNKPEQEDQPF